MPSYEVWTGFSSKDIISNIHQIGTCLLPPDKGLLGIGTAPSGKNVVRWMSCVLTSWVGILLLGERFVSERVDGQAEAQKGVRNR